MSYLNSVTIIGFVGADPEQRESRANGAPFTVLSVATRRSWKNAEGEWQSRTDWHRVCVFRPRLAEYVATTIKKGSHVLVEGSLVSTTYERETARARKPRPTSRRSGAFAPKSSASSTVANPNRKLSLPGPLLRVKRSTRLIRLLSNGGH